MDSKEDIEFEHVSVEPDLVIMTDSGEESQQEAVVPRKYARNSDSSKELQQCPECKKYFKRLRYHIMSRHSLGEDVGRSLECKFCQKRFLNIHNLNVHIRTHTGLKPHVCQVCGKAFAQSGNLVLHLRTHSGLKPHKCDICGKAFTQSGNLNNHIRIHFDEKPFKCHICAKAYTQASNLNWHMKTSHQDVQ